MLTSDQVELLTQQVILGLPLTISGEEAESFCASLRKDIEKAKKNKWVIELPFEIPDIKMVHRSSPIYFTVPSKESPYYIVYKADPTTSLFQRFDLDKWEWVDDLMAKREMNNPNPNIVKSRGSAKSGNFGHKGRPGQVGGSGEGGSSPEENDTASPNSTISTYLSSVHNMGVSRAKESVVLIHGKQYTPQKLPSKYKMAQAKKCFQNAFELANSNPELTYVEGFAVPDFVPIPIHHAWTVDKQGKVVDNTWKTPGAEYMGVPFELPFIYKVQTETEQYGVMDFHSKTFREKYETKRSK